MKAHPTMINKINNTTIKAKFLPWWNSWNSGDTFPPLLMSNPPYTLILLALLSYEILVKMV